MAVRGSCLEFLEFFTGIAIEYPMVSFEFRINPRGLSGFCLLIVQAEVWLRQTDQNEHKQQLEKCIQQAFRSKRVAWMNLDALMVRSDDFI